MFSNAQDLSTYALAGRAVLTLVSERTEARYTFKVSQAHDKATGELQPRWFVALLTGPDNTADYAYMGMIDNGEFRVTRGSKFAADSTPVRAFAYMWRHATEQGVIAPELVVHHEGHCGRCGRALTVPESILNGIGPECMRKMGG